MLSKENLYVYNCYVKNSFLVKKALGEMFDRNFHWGGVISLSSYLILQSVVDHFFVSVKNNYYVNEHKIEIIKL